MLKILDWRRSGKIRTRQHREVRISLNLSHIFLNSSMAEHSAVNRRVVGSSPTWGVKKKKDHPRDGPFLFFATQIKLKQIPLQKLPKAVNCIPSHPLPVADEGCDGMAPRSK